MAGDGVSSLILLSASIVVALIVASAIFITALEMKDSMTNRAQLEENYMKSKLKIINDPAYTPYNLTTNTLTLYVKNIGTTILDMNTTSVILNGTAYSLTYDPAGSSTIKPLSGNVWAPQSVVVIKIKPNPKLQAGADYIATVVSSYGIKDSISFHVR